QSEFHSELAQMRAVGKIGVLHPTGSGGRRLDTNDDEYHRIWAEYDAAVAEAAHDQFVDNMAALGVSTSAAGAGELAGRATGGKGGGLAGGVAYGLSVYLALCVNKVIFMGREAEARDGRDEALAKAGYPVPPRPTIDEGLAEVGHQNMNF
ncbi:MAG: hypothetical protein JXA57_15285, partial [Armatimonadetes bacterium]|nr:hypothetical protein [Armatimonadota bacterium]